MLTAAEAEGTEVTVAGVEGEAAVPEAEVVEEEDWLA